MTISKINWPPTFGKIKLTLNHLDVAICSVGSMQCGSFTCRFSNGRVFESPGT